MDKEKRPMTVTAAERDLILAVRAILQGKLTVQICNHQPDHIIEGIQTRKFETTY